MSILAIDPGYDRCGIAVINKGAIVHSSCIVTDKKHSHAERLAAIYEGVKERIETYRPAVLAIETLFFSANKTTALKVAEARGAIMVLAGVTKLPLIEISPQKVKLAMTGTGNAAKPQVAKMVSLTLKIDTSGMLDDEIDAIALAVAAESELRFHKIH